MFEIILWSKALRENAYEASQGSSAAGLLRAFDEARVQPESTRVFPSSFDHGALFPQSISWDLSLVNDGLPLRPPRPPR